MPGLGFAYFVASLLASLPWIIAGGVLLVVAIRTLRSERPRAAWAVVMVPFAIAGVVIGLGVIVACGSEHGVPPCWVIPLDVVAVVAAAAAVGSVLLAAVLRPRAVILRWLGPVAGAGLAVGAVIGLFLLSSIPPIRTALAEAACTNDPSCFTAGEQAEADRIDGEATLWIDGAVMLDGAIAGARCEHGGPSDGYAVRATFDADGRTVEVEASVMADGSYRWLGINSSDFMGYPGKGWDPATAVRVEPGTTPAAGRMTFEGITDAMGSGGAVSGEITWACPGFPSDVTP